MLDSAVEFQVIRSILDDPKRNYKEWNDLSANEYLEKARSIFQKMDLQNDLDELDKIAASN